MLADIEEWSKNMSENNPAKIFLAEEDLSKIDFATLINMADYRDELGNTVLHLLLTLSPDNVDARILLQSNNLKIAASALKSCVNVKNYAGLTPLAHYVKNSKTNEFREKLSCEIISLPSFDIEDHHNLAGEDLLSSMIKSNFLPKMELKTLLDVIGRDHKYCKKAIFFARSHSIWPLMLAAGIDAKAKNENGHSVAENYIFTKKNINLQAVDAMVNCGAHLSLHVNHDGKTVSTLECLQLAVKEQQETKLKINSRYYKGPTDDEINQMVAQIQRQCLINEVDGVRLGERNTTFKPRRNRIDI